MTDLEEQTLANTIRKFNCANVAFECNMQPSASIWSPNFVHVIIINHCTSLWNTVCQNCGVYLDSSFPRLRQEYVTLRRKVYWVRSKLPQQFSTWIVPQVPQESVFEHQIFRLDPTATCTACKFLSRTTVLLFWIEFAILEEFTSAIIAVPRALFL